ncbi:MAG: hypothetical protein WCW40_01080 [Bacteroidota bacterium]
MTRRGVQSVFVCTVILCCAGCSRIIELSADGLAIPVSMTADAGRPYSVIRHFSTSLGFTTPIGSRIFGGDPPELMTIIGQEMKKSPGDAVVNLKITVMVDSKTYTVQGDIVKFAGNDEGSVQIKKAVDTLATAPMPGKSVLEFDPETGLPKQ